jgi:uncharacterized protein (DUF736 family)
LIFSGLANGTERSLCGRYEISLIPARIPSGEDGWRFRVERGGQWMGEGLRESIHDARKDAQRMCREDAARVAN